MSVITLFFAETENCVDRHANKNPESVALIWEKDEPGSHETVTYRWVYFRNYAQGWIWWWVWGCVHPSSLGRGRGCQLTQFHFLVLHGQSQPLFCGLSYFITAVLNIR